MKKLRAGSVQRLCRWGVESVGVSIVSPRQGGYSPVKSVLGVVTAQIPTQVITIAKGRLPEGARLWGFGRGCGWKASQYSPLYHQLRLFLFRRNKDRKGKKSDGEKSDWRCAGRTNTAGCPTSDRGPVPLRNDETDHLLTPCFLQKRCQLSQQPQLVRSTHVKIHGFKLGLGKMLPKISEARGAKTRRNSQLVSPRVYGTRRGRWRYAFLPYLQEIIFTNPRENTHLGNLGFWSADSQGGGKRPPVERKQGLHPQVSHPNAKQVLVGDGLLLRRLPHTCARATFPPPCLALTSWHKYKQLSHWSCCRDTVFSFPLRS